MARKIGPHRNETYDESRKAWIPSIIVHNGYDHYCGYHAWSVAEAFVHLLNPCYAIDGTGIILELEEGQNATIRDTAQQPR